MIAAVVILVFAVVVVGCLISIGYIVGWQKGWRECDEMEKRLNGNDARRQVTLADYQKAVGLNPDGWIGRRTAHAAFDERGWPEGSYFDLTAGLYFVRGSLDD